MRQISRLILTYGLVAIGVISAVALQASFIAFLPVPLSHLNILAVISIYSTVIFGLPRTLPWIAGAGLAYDLYTVGGFGVHAWSFGLGAAAVHFSSRHLVTNRTLAALIFLGFFGSVVGAAGQLAVSWLYYTFNLTDSAWIAAGLSLWGWPTAMAGVLLEVAAVAILGIAWRGGSWDSPSASR